MTLTPGAEAWVRYMPEIISVRDAKALEAMGLVSITLIRTEPIALCVPRKMAHVEPTDLAMKLRDK